MTKRELKRVMKKVKEKTGQGFRAPDIFFWYEPEGIWLDFFGVQQDINAEYPDGLRLYFKDSDPIADEAYAAIARNPETPPWKPEKRPELLPKIQGLIRAGEV